MGLDTHYGILQQYIMWNTKLYASFLVEEKHNETHTSCTKRSEERELALQYGEDRLTFKALH